MTPTPNPTAEKVIADAITAYWADEERSGPNRGPEAHDRECGIDAAKALRAHGLLSEGAPQALDPEKVADEIGRHLYVMVAPGPHECTCGAVLDYEQRGYARAHKLHQARALCEAYEKGGLT